MLCMFRHLVNARFECVNVHYCIHNLKLEKKIQTKNTFLPTFRFELNSKIN